MSVRLLVILIFSMFLFPFGAFYLSEIGVLYCYDFSSGFIIVFLYEMIVGTIILVNWVYSEDEPPIITIIHEIAVIKNE